MVGQLRVILGSYHIFSVEDSITYQPKSSPAGLHHYISISPNLYFMRDCQPMITEL